MKRVMSITAVLAAVTCHTAYGQLDGIGGAAQEAAGQTGSAAGQVESQSDNAAANTQVAPGLNADAGANSSTDPGSESGTDANTGVGVQTDANASSTDLNTAAQAGVNAATQNQIDRGARNLNRGINRGRDVIGGILPPIPQQARTGNSGPYDARWRFTQRNGQWWYYSPQNQWMVRENDQWQAYDDSYQPLAGGNAGQGEYRSGYRGDMPNQGQGMQNQGQYGDSGAGQMQQMTAHAGPVYMLRYDHYGREYICVHGQRVYFDDPQAMRSEPMPNDSRGDGRYESGRQSLDATDSEDQRPLAEPQSDSANVENESATEPPPAPTPDSSDNASDASKSDNSSENDNDGQAAEKFNNDDSANQSDAGKSAGEESDSDDA